MIYPVPGSRLPGKGGPLDYLYQRTLEHKHRGIDFVAPLGSPVLASEGGTVVAIATKFRPGFSGYGRVIVIQGTSGRYFLYAHLDRVLVSEGEQVSEGEKIGTVGNTMFTRQNPEQRMKDTHLHFEVSARPYPMHSEATRLNPRPLFQEIQPEQPTIEPKKAAARLKKTERIDRALIPISIAILAVIWLLTMLKR